MGVLSAEKGSDTYFQIPFFKIFFINVFIYIFGCVGSSLLHADFSSCGEWGLLFAAVRRLLVAVLLLLRSTGSRHTGFSSCGTQALECRLSSCGAQT